MDFDFNLILVPLTIGLGIIWLLDKLTLKQRKTRGRGKESLLVRWASVSYTHLTLPTKRIV